MTVNLEIKRYIEKKGIPQKWCQYVNKWTEKELWPHYFFWEIYEVFTALNWPKNLKGTVVLDYGAGTGIIDCAMNLLGATVVLLDKSLDALEECKRHASSLGITENIFFVCGDIFSPPFPQKYFDIVWSGGVIEHFPEPEKLLKIKSSHLKQYGTLVVTLPSFRSLNTFLFRPIRRWLNKYPFDLWGREKSYSPNKLKNLLISIGFSHAHGFQCNLRRGIIDDYLVIEKVTRFIKKPIVKKCLLSLFNIIDRIELKTHLGSVMGFDTVVWGIKE